MISRIRLYDVGKHASLALRCPQKMIPQAVACGVSSMSTYRWRTDTPGQIGPQVSALRPKVEICNLAISAAAILRSLAEHPCLKIEMGGPKDRTITPRESMRSFRDAECGNILRVYKGQDRPLPRDVRIKKPFNSLITTTIIHLARLRSGWPRQNQQSRVPEE